MPHPVFFCQNGDLVFRLRTSIIYYGRNGVQYNFLFYSEILESFEVPNHCLIALDDLHNIWKLDLKTGKKTFLHHAHCAEFPNILGGANTNWILIVYKWKGIEAVDIQSKQSHVSLEKIREFVQRSSFWKASFVFSQIDYLFWQPSRVLKKYPSIFEAEQFLMIGKKYVLWDYYDALRKRYLNIYYLKTSKWKRIDRISLEKKTLFSLDKKRFILIDQKDRATIYTVREKNVKKVKHFELPKRHSAFAPIQFSSWGYYLLNFKDHYYLHACHELESDDISCFDWIEKQNFLPSVLTKMVKKYIVGDIDTLFSMPTPLHLNSIVNVQK